MDCGDIDTAIRLSAEAVTAADRRWTEARNSGHSSGSELTETLIAGSRHIEALIGSSRIGDAFSTGLLLQLMESIDSGDKSVPPSEPLMVVQFLTLKTFTDMISTVHDDSADVREHASAIVALSASLLYNSYLELNAASSRNPYLVTAFELLKEMRDIGAIRYPAVNINGTEIPVTDRATITGDIIGRARAMGWFVCD